MAGWDGVTKLYAVHPPAVALQAALDERFGVGFTLVTSRAVSGTTAVELVAGTDRLNAPWPRSVDANIIVVNHGINDMTHHGDQVAYRTALRTIAANTAGAKLVFETPNAVLVYDVWPYAQIMRDVASEAHVPVADTFALPLRITLLGDWAHPSDEGYLNIVKFSLAPAVMPVVAAMLCR